MGTSRAQYSIALSAFLQLALGAFTGHPYDDRVFLSVGYTVSQGHSPYLPTDVSGVFGAALFPSPVPGIGYLPSWSIVLAISYLVSYNLVHNLLLYNLATKVPIVIGNILLAMLVGRVVLSQTSDSGLSKSAMQFMLFNPYVIYTTAAWGQFDTVSVLLMLFAIQALSHGKTYTSAAALGASIAVKLIPIVLLPLLVFHTRKRAGRFDALAYCIVTMGVVGLSLFPFLLGWSLEPIITNWNVHFIRVGAFSPLSILLQFGIGSSTKGFEFVGYLWVPSLLVIYYFLFRRSSTSFMGMILSALALMLGLSLTRAWVSEQNLNFVLPLVLIAAIGHGWPRKWVTATWLLPLLFALFNFSPLLMLFLVVPESAMQAIQSQLVIFLNAVTLGQLGPDPTSVIRLSITVAWLIMGTFLLRKSISECGSKNETFDASGSGSRSPDSRCD